MLQILSVLGMAAPSFHHCSGTYGNFTLHLALSRPDGVFDLPQIPDMRFSSEQGPLPLANSRERFGKTLASGIAAMHALAARRL